ncbi:unnamed protein product [Triticum turgidum subsp. durum]|uniref:Uncharacterized protein n=1 Tax=Triticum turgidum subsp. durum TaxID=4567 RepID=A0A9R0VC23_TRITD|nr:unnamed protein product [Triticum turgidum subsp. durum]
MAVEWSDGGEEFLLPDEFLDDDFFSEEEKAAVAARSESDEEDSLAGLSRRLAGLLGGDKLAVTPAKRNGTGVFLPRPAGAPAEARKKSGCSTVLVPARVVHALNLNLDDLGAQPRYAGGIVLDHDALISRSNAMLASQKMRAAEASAPPALCHSS